MGCKSGQCSKISIPSGIFIVTPLLEGWPIKAKEAPSHHEVRPHRKTAHNINVLISVSMSTTQYFHINILSFLS